MIEPSPMRQSNITHKQLFIHKHKIIIILYYVYITAHLYGSESYNHIKVNFRLFNAYKRYKVIKVKDGYSTINWSKTVKGLRGCYQLNSIQIYLSTWKLLKKWRSSMSSVKVSGPQKNAYMCANHMHNTWLKIDGVRK